MSSRMQQIKQSSLNETYVWTYDGVLETKIKLNLQIKKFIHTFTYKPILKRTNRFRKYTSLQKIFIPSVSNFSHILKKH